MIKISNFLFNCTNFFCYSQFFDYILTLGVLFSTVVREVVVTKLVILGISPLTPFSLALREVVVTKLVILGISPLTSF